MDRDTMWEDICSEGMEENADDIRAGGCNVAKRSAKDTMPFSLQMWNQVSGTDQRDNKALESKLGTNTNRPAKNYFL